MSKSEVAAYEFGPFRLDAVERRLLLEGKPVPLTAKLFDILLLLVNRRGELVTKDDFMNEVWGGAIVEENNLSVSMSALRKSLGERRGAREYIETVPKSGYRFVARVTRVRDEESPATGESHGPVSALAVLPLLNVGGDPELEYLADGLTESIITSLSRLPGLRVMARSTVFRYKGREPDPLHIRRELGVQAVLIGRVVRLDRRISLSVELVDARDGAQIWAAQYKCPITEVFNVQEDITDAIRAKLGDEQRKLVGALPPQPPPLIPEAYHLYLKGRYFWNKRTLAGVKRAVSFFSDAARLDAGYALAHVGLADCYISLIYMSALPAVKGIRLVKEEALRALALDEGNAEAHASLAYAEMLSFNWGGADRAFCRSLELNPGNAQAHSRFSVYLSVWGRTEDALAEAEKALSIDLLSPPTAVNAARVFYYARQYERSVRHCLQALEIDPGFGAAHGLLSLAYERMGRLKEATSQIRKASAKMEGDPEVLSILGFLHAVAGRPRAARKVLDELLNVSGRGRRRLSPLFVALIHTGLRDRDRAFEWLEKDYDGRTYLLSLAVTPAFDYLRPDPRYAALLSRIGIPG